MARTSLRRFLPAAPAALQHLLDPERGPLAPPIRSELFGAERFAQHGRSLGTSHDVSTGPARSAAFFPRLRSNLVALREAQCHLASLAAAGYEVGPAAEWLLDNFHLIEAQLATIRQGLPRRYFRALPMLRDPPLSGLPRVYGIAWAYVAHTDGAFDDALLVGFLRAYQQTRELRFGELWALPTTLRVVLVESLRRLAERVAAQQAARDLADLCADDVDTLGTAALDGLRALLTRRDVERVFLLQLWQRLREPCSAEAAARREAAMAWLRTALPDPPVAQAQQLADQAADNLSVSNAVGSLRMLAEADWADLVDRSSALMQRMRSAPLFEAEHPLTRDRTLRGIERLARRSGRSELEVADAVLDGMRHAPDAASGTAGHALDGAGRTPLWRRLGLRTGPRWPPSERRNVVVLIVYLGSLLLGTAGLLALLLPAHGAGTALAWTVLAGALMLFPASEAVVAIVNRLIGESLRPQPLPRLALATGIPAEHRVLVVIPAMLTDPAAIAQLAHRLLLHHLANVEPQAQFALLTDAPDADRAAMPADAALLANAVQQLRALNAAHDGGAAAGSAPRFILLHRARRWSETEQRWIGWERKRGKLEQLVAALADGRRDAFVDLGNASRLAAGTRYVLTLDSDTELPPGRLRELVGIAAHPQNQPRLDEAGRRVVAGYGILQPRVDTPLPSPREATPFRWLFAGQSGIDPYSAASSEVYQDVFAEGSFGGKGLLHVQAVHATLGGRLPEDRVLSHDLLEGSLARCALVSDVSLVEAPVSNAELAAARAHRWTRGDWQLLPFLLQRRWRLRAVHRWKLFDNLRRSLVAPMSLALLALAMAGLGAAPLPVLALVLMAYAAGPLMGAVAGLLPNRADVALRHFLAHAGLDLARAALGGLWQLALLPHHAVQAVDAVARALWRQAVSRRHLLQWTTASTAEARLKKDLPTALRHHAGESALAAVLFVALMAAGGPVPWLAAALCALWAGTPLWLWWSSRPWTPDPAARLSLQDRAYLAGIARDTWRLFERCVGPEDQHLPPDNLQTLPHDETAHRTSPTNIGLYLLATACARQFGWIDTAELVTRLEATLATLAQLQRHRGHFLNWYDTTTRMPLAPLYVSTVDSGNLSGHLLAVAAACRELATDDVQRLRLRALAERCERLAWEPEFGFLYAKAQRLFHIGYRVADDALDTSLYDLLASESRLASLLAIAKGDVPVQHWAALGRASFASGLLAGLRSWSGSMFEYLMPSLVLDEPRGSLLREACRAAVREQVAFARQRQVPWGVSESAYAGRDHTLAYQYAPQGVPSLALRRTPPDELVIAPYATALAAPLAPGPACRNFIALEAAAARGRYGFIEAMDYTPVRQAPGHASTPVQTYMAHHQGMTIVALANLLLDGAPRRWGMAHARVEAMASLLHERAPRQVQRRSDSPGAAASTGTQPPPPGLQREVLPGAFAVAPTHVLSNGRYSVSLRPNGAGESRLGSIGLTRWRDDALRDACGSFFYLRWDRQPQPVSITQHPAPDHAASYRSTFHADRVLFDTSWPELESRTTVWVSPEDDIEFRQVELRNLGERTLELELLSAFEPTLADPRADAAHPAFSNLFLRARWRAADQALVFERTPRLATERGVWAAHFLAGSDERVLAVQVQVDRQRWLGRNRALHDPRAEVETPGATDDPLGGVLDTGLDPVCALSVHLRIEPHAKVLLTFATAASDNGDVLSAVIDKYRQTGHVNRASLMSATLAGIRLHELRIGAENFAALQHLTTALQLSLSRPREALADSDPGGEVCDRRLLWRFGLSGERPIVLVSIGAMAGLGLLRALAQALQVWRWGGIDCDLVVLNADPPSYAAALQHELAALRDRHASDATPQAGPSAALHVLRADELSDDERSTLARLARVQLRADGRPLALQVHDWCDAHEQDSDRRHEVSTAALATCSAPGVRAASGAFASGSGAFTFTVGAALRPTRPWINVLANPGFGTHVSEAGGGYTWAGNSRLHQLTAWSNDPVADPPSEWLLLQDLASGEGWSLAPSAWADVSACYRVSHGPGQTVINHERGGLDVSAAWCVDARRAVKQMRVRIVNRGSRTRRLRLVGIAEWILGAQRRDRATTVTAMLSQRLAHGRVTALLCTQLERSAGFGGGTAFLAMAHADDEGIDWTCDRRECFDARGRFVVPDHFGAQRGEGLDPCAALATSLTLAAGAVVERVLLLGHGDSPEAARALATQAAAECAGERAAGAQAAWNRLLGGITVRTPDPLFDVMVNRWLLYQTVACRLWAKAGFYQAGGATGFRDQLQDAMALAWSAPELLRAQLLRCAARQFEAGDVQHWWHEPQGNGVRTHFSDDLLWLPWAGLHYVRVTGDAAAWDEAVPFLEGADIPDGAEDVYETPVASAVQASLYEHAARTIDRSLAVGRHGLPLMGSGDWNDGMNRVGHEGRGESVWLGWFLCALVRDFAPLARQRGDLLRARTWEHSALGWRAALEAGGWDGAWYRRAYFDDGTPLGSRDNAQARIDLIAQAWAVLSGVAPPGRQRQALRSADTLLVDRHADLVHLLDPPLSDAVPSAGYIQAYPPGVRENGGQYSHAGAWAVMAQAQLSLADGAPAAEAEGAADTVYRYFCGLSPAHRAVHPDFGDVYGLEPYVMAGDVYTQPPYVGRGGWSWYTGAAAWMHRAAVESMFGLRLEARQLSLRPCLPMHWMRAELTLERDGRSMQFVFVRAEPGAALAAAGDASARLLPPGASVDWRRLGPLTRFVVPLSLAYAPSDGPA